jgi:hypothetical protein
MQLGVTCSYRKQWPGCTRQRDELESSTLRDSLRLLQNLRNRNLLQETGCVFIRNIFDSFCPNANLATHVSLLRFGYSASR